MLLKGMCCDKAFWTVIHIHVYDISRLTKKWSPLQIYVKAGIYHGTEALCEAQVTKEVESNNPRWNEWLEFLNMMDIPRSARLCLSICSVNRRRNRKVRVLSLITMNSQLFL